MSAPKSRYQKALQRNLFEANKSILERKILIGFEAAGRCSASPFLHIVYAGLFNDMIAHAIKIFEKKDTASFWYIRKYKEKEINEFIQGKEINIGELDEIAGGLRHIRNKTHFHIDKNAVGNSDNIWEEAGITGKDLANAVDKVCEILNYLFKIEYNKDFDSPEYNSKNATLIAKYAEENKL